MVVLQGRMGGFLGKDAAQDGVVVIEGLDKVLNGGVRLGLDMVEEIRMLNRNGGEGRWSHGGDAATGSKRARISQDNDLRGARATKKDAKTQPMSNRIPDAHGQRLVVFYRTRWTKQEHPRSG